MDLTRCIFLFVSASWSIVTVATIPPSVLVAVKSPVLSSSRMVAPLIDVSSCHNCAVPV